MIQAPTLNYLRRPRAFNLQHLHLPGQRFAPEEFTLNLR